MEQNPIVDLEQQIKSYEAVVGPLTDKYPFDFAISFEPNGRGEMCPSPQMPSLKLILYPDGSFKANYLINCADRYWWIYFDAERKFE